MKDEIKEINIPEKVLVALGDLTNGALNYYKAPETVKVRHNTILDCITNLQEENKILKTRNKILSEDITKDIINCDVIQTVCGIPIEEIPELKLYKSRNEKAIECINHYAVENEDYSKIYNDEEKDLLNILNGGDE